MSLLSEVKRDNKEWFSAGNRRMFGDVRYNVKRGKVSHNAYLIRLTSAWSDMFGQPKRYTYRINALDYDAGWHIGELVDVEFASMDQVNNWLMTQ